MDGKWLSAEVCSAMSGKVQAEDVGVKVLPCDLAFLGENLQWVAVYMCSYQKKVL